MKRRVLIVDDVEDIRVMLRHMIEKEGHTIVAEATNGIEAVEKFREHRPDVTIMDIDMPFKTGVEAAREIRELAHSSRIVFCSGGFSKHETPPAELRTGQSSLLRKPFLPSQLYQELCAC
jgi:two-component system chemotaxis response regulator CheY